MEKIWNFCSFICHQHLSHSFYIKDVQFPLCVRCTSLYLSCVVTIIVLLLYIKFYKISVFYTSTQGLLMLFFFMFLICIDVFTSYFGIYASNNISRVVTGFLCGSSFMILVYILLCIYCYRKFSSIYSITFLSVKKLIMLVCIISIFFLILLYLFFTYTIFFFIVLFLCLVGYFLFYICILCYLLFLVLKME